MAASLTALAPPRARAGDSLVLAGLGFAASGNTVKVDGIAATVGAESTTSITVTVPGGIRTDRFVPVEITHATDSSASTRQWWSKATKASLQTFLMELQLPGQFEDWGAAASLEHPEDIEAKDIEALHECLQYLPTDALQEAGDMAGRNADGVGRVTGAIGSTVMLDRATSGGGSGIGHRVRQPCLLTWGTDTEDISPVLMSANSPANTGGADPNGTEQHTPNGGKGVVLVVYVDKQSGTADLDRVELLRNGSVVYDSGTGLSIAAQGSHVRNAFDDLGDVAASDRLSVRITQGSGTGVIDCLAYLMIF